MTSKSLRWGLWAGPGHVVAILVGNGLSTSGDAGKTDAASLLADIQRHHTVANDLGLWLEVIGFVLFFCFLGAVYRVLRRAEGADGWLSVSAFGAGLASLAVKVGSAAPVAAAFYRKDDLDAITARTLTDLNGAAFVIDGLLVALFVLLAALSTLETGLLPRWLSWAAIVVGLAGLATPVVGIFDMDSYFPIPFLLCLLWIAGVGARLAIREGKTAAAGG